MTREERWVQQAAAGDQEAFAALVETYEKMVYTLAVRMTGNPHDGEEAAQEAFLAAWRGLPFFKGESAFSTWLYRLTANACIDLLRKERRRTAAASLDDEEQEEPAAAGGWGDPAEALERGQQREAVRRCMDALSPEHRQVLSLREFAGLSYEEIAQTLDLEVGTVKSRISRARLQLRKLLLQDGNFSPPDASNENRKGGSA